MKLASYIHKGQESFGIVRGEGVFEDGRLVQRAARGARHDVHQRVHATLVEAQLRWRVWVWA